ncbi:MAG: hypothetical protein ACQ9MH_26950, partial [Nitrospinales bacterium]
DPSLAYEINLETYYKNDSPLVKAYAIAGLCRNDPLKYRDKFKPWLYSNKLYQRKVAAIAAGESTDHNCIEHP